ncbi:hypothetical protein LPJ73_005616 [Coemansia sp. RSA 2703]|nr:hypothetical protein LPJ73_005616 [Coemansia sp. RSA 2703]KAJ2392479.1 hypothetical protein GGI05_002657 [Coemansia sp. RSA 2603]
MDAQGASVMATVRKLFRLRRARTPSDPLADDARMQLASAIASHYLLVAGNCPLDEPPADPPASPTLSRSTPTPWWTRFTSSPSPSPSPCGCSDNGVCMVAAREHSLLFGKYF